MTRCHDAPGRQITRRCWSKRRMINATSCSNLHDAGLLRGSAIHRSAGGCGKVLSAEQAMGFPRQLPVRLAPAVHGDRGRDRCDLRYQPEIRPPSLATPGKSPAASAIADLLFGGLARIALGSGRTRRARGPRRTCRPYRSRQAAIFYHHVPLVLAGGNCDDASGGKFRTNPAKPSRRSALDFHCFGWAEFETHAVLARSPDPSDDRQLAARDGSGRDQYFCTRIFAPCEHTDSCNSCDADKLCEHGHLPAVCRNGEFDHQSSLKTRLRLRARLAPATDTMSPVPPATSPLPPATPTTVAAAHVAMRAHHHRPRCGRRLRCSRRDTPADRCKTGDNNDRARQRIDEKAAAANCSHWVFSHGSLASDRNSAGLLPRSRGPLCWRG
jgi:hypothetical protein